MNMRNASIAIVAVAVLAAGTVDAGYSSLAARIRASGSASGTPGWSSGTKGGVRTSITISSAAGSLNRNLWNSVSTPAVYDTSYVVSAPSSGKRKGSSSVVESPVLKRGTAKYGSSSPAGVGSSASSFSFSGFKSADSKSKMSVSSLVGRKTSTQVRKAPKDKSALVLAYKYGGSSAKSGNTTAKSGNTTAKSGNTTAKSVSGGKSTVSGMPSWYYKSWDLSDTVKNLARKHQNYLSGLNSKAQKIANMSPNERQRVLANQRPLTQWYKSKVDAGLGRLNLDLD